MKFSSLLFFPVQCHGQMFLWSIDTFFFLFFSLAFLFSIAALTLFSMGGSAVRHPPPLLFLPLAKKCQGNPYLNIFYVSQLFLRMPLWNKNLKFIFTTSQSTFDFGRKNRPIYFSPYSIIKKGKKCVIILRY